MHNYICAYQTHNSVLFIHRFLQAPSQPQGIYYIDRNHT